MRSGVADVVRGESGFEELVWWVPLFVSSLVTAIMMILRLRSRSSGDATVPPRPGAEIQRLWRRLEKAAAGIGVLLIILYTTAWTVRTGDLALQVLVGSITLVVYWIFMLILLRILRSRMQRSQSPRT
jgi:uncharacterized membrane protein